MNNYDLILAELLAAGQITSTANNFLESASTDPERIEGLIAIIRGFINKNNSLSGLSIPDITQ